MWCYPEKSSYKARLREVYKAHSRFKGQAKKLNKWVRKNFAAERQYEKMIDGIFSKEERELFDQINEMFSEISPSA